MKQLFNTIIIIWLLLLTVFTIYYVSYDRNMQSLDLKLEEINLNIHSEMVDAIVNNNNRISDIEAEVKDVSRRI